MDYKTKDLNSQYIIYTKFNRFTDRLIMSMSYSYIQFLKSRYDSR